MGGIVSQSKTIDFHEKGLHPSQQNKTKFDVCQGISIRKSTAALYQAPTCPSEKGVLSSVTCTVEAFNKTICYLQNVQQQNYVQVHSNSVKMLPLQYGDKSFKLERLQMCCLIGEKAVIIWAFRRKSEQFIATLSNTAVGLQKCARNSNIYIGKKITFSTEYFRYHITPRGLDAFESLYYPGYFLAANDKSIFLKDAKSFAERSKLDECSDILFRVIYDDA